MTTTPEEPLNVTPDAAGPAVPPPPAPEAAVPPPPAYGAPTGAVPPPAPAYGSAPPPAYAAGPVQPLSDSDSRMWAMLAHIGGALLSWIVPLVVWLVMKDRSRFVEEQSKEALNFQITLFIAHVIAGFLWVIIIGMVLTPLIAIAGLVFGIIGGLAANKGEAYRYPFALRLIK